MLLTGPAPPFLEYGFYFSSISDADAFALLVNELVRQDARLTGEAVAFHDLDARDKPFASPTDLLADASKVKYVELDRSSLMRYLVDNDIRLLQVGLTNAIGLARQEIVGYTFIHPGAVGVDMHPLAIRTGGSVFSGPDRQVTKAARKSGKKVYERFLSLVRVLTPAYAAITVEYSLECPTDLRQDPRSYAFRDFFISEEYIGATRLRYIQRIFKEAYVEIVDGGLYVSCFSAFNPAHKELNSEVAISKSIDIAKLIASMA